MKKAIFAVLLMAGLITAAAFNVRVEVKPNVAHACDGNDNC